MESGQEELKLKTNGRHGIYSMAFNPDGQHIAFGGDEGDIKICDSKIGQIIAVLKEAGSVSSCAYSPDGRHIVSAGLKNDLTIWDVKEVKKILSLEGHTNIVRSAVYSPDGQRIASVSDDRTLRIWDTQNGQTILMFKGHTEGVDTVVFSPDGRRVATAGRNVKVWDAWSGQEILTLNTDLDSRPAFNREGDRIASAEGDLIVWDAQTGEQLFQLKGKWPEKDWTDPDFRTEGDTPVSLEVFMEFSQDQSRIASMIDPTTIKIVDAREMREICRLKGHTQFIESVSFSPDGRCIATASYDNSVRLWNGETGQELHVLRPQTKTASNNLELSALRFSPDGSRIAFSSGERESVSSDGAVIEIWDALGGRQLLLLKGHKSLVPDLMFSPDGLRIASASWDESVRVWDAHNGQEIQSLNGHTDIVDAVAFSPDGRRIASAGRDHTMRIWDLESGQEVLALRGHSELRGRSDIFRGRSDINRSVAFDPDGRRIVSSSWDRTVKILDARTWTPELRAETESIGLINHKLETGTLKENLIEAIATDITISDKVRVVAQSLAERFQERPEALNGVSWMIVARPDHSQERYLWALRRAERACQLAPDDGNFLNTLGIAQFRVGDYAKAVDTLTRSENLNSKEYGQSIPADLAFLAMAQDELGRHHEAQEILQRLRTTITLPDFANDAESQGFLREAAERIETRRP
jgi:WD40 repeat protein